MSVTKGLEIVTPTVAIMNFAFYICNLLKNKILAAKG